MVPADARDNGEDLGRKSWKCPEIRSLLCTVDGAPWVLPSFSKAGCTSYLESQVLLSAAKAVKRPPSERRRKSHPLLFRNPEEPEFGGFIGAENKADRRVVFWVV